MSEELQTVIKPHPRLTNIAACKDVIWRNMPRGATTFGECANECGRAPGRGCGPCVVCAEEALGRLTTPQLARSFVAAIIDLGILEDSLDEHDKD